MDSIGAENDLRAGGNLVDSIDADCGFPGIVLANVAPRHGAAKKWMNGDPAIVTGSSGLREKRFLEVVLQGGRASDETHAVLGAPITVGAS